MSTAESDAVGIGAAVWSSAAENNDVGSSAKGTPSSDTESSVGERSDTENGTVESSDKGGEIKDAERNGGPLC